MSKAWLVTGQCGEYSDWRFWVVAVFTDKARADEWKANAEEWERENRDRVKALDKPWEAAGNPFDPRNDSWSQTAEYNVEEDVLDPALPVIAAAPVNPDSPARRPPRES